MKKKMSFTVLAEHTAEVVGSGGLPVLSTPMLIAYMEQVAYLLAEEVLQEGESTVGVHISMDHLAPSLVGDEIEVQAELIEQNERMFLFLIEATTQEKLLAKAMHQRAKIKKQSFMEREKKKS